MLEHTTAPSALTPQQATQAALIAMAESMEKYSVPYACIDPQSGQIAFMNQGFREQLRELGDSNGQRFLSDDAATAQALQTCLQNRDPVSVVNHLIGRVVQLVPMLDGEQLLGVQCFLFTHTGTQHPPAAAPGLSHGLGHGLADFQLVLQQLPAMVWLSLPNGDVFWMNALLREFLYEDPAHADASDGRWIEAIHPEDITRTNSWFLQFLINQVEGGVEYRLKNRQGIYHWFHTTGRVFKQGEQVYIAGINVDITAYKERELHNQRALEQELRAHEQQLKDMQTVQQELVRNQKVELVESIAGGISHDLNNLLFVINLNTNLLKKHLANDQARGYLDVISKTIKRANRLSSQLVAFSGRKPQSTQAFQPLELIDDIEELLLNAVGAEVDFHLEAADDLGVIQTDKHYFENALLNMAINARDAVSGRGKVQIRLYNQKRQSEGESRNYVVVEVSDDGSGIPLEVQSRIFDPFFTTKDVGKGSGLGLPMVQNFARQSGGFIEVDSTPGAGTHFFLGIPHCNLAAAAAEMAEPVADVGHESILIVEDDMTVRDSLAQSLYALGYQVTAASNIDVAVKYLRSGIAVDMVLSDIRMPGTLKVPDLLRIMEEEKFDIPVLLATGYSGDILIEDGLLDHKHQVLFKPFSMDTLGVKIREVLDQARKR
ncbi:ATP-binding protein [Comamonas sp. J-3]|uniref:ATP-binding protein n=1 Tax=Comamonas trifloxystrobinivorans TaxID=3350256 RepID=UPI00372C1206